MARVQKTLDQQLAELKAQRHKIDARAKALEGRKKARDLRQRARGEKLLLQLVLRRLDDEPAFRAAVLGQLDAATLKPDEREAVQALLSPVKSTDTNTDAA